MAPHRIRSDNLKAIIDTSFALDAARMRLDAIGELERIAGRKFELLVPAETMKELEGKRDGPVAKAMLISRGATIVPGNARIADAAISKLAVATGTLVCTDDALLRKVLRAKNVPVAFIRGKHTIEIDGPIE